MMSRAIARGELTHCNDAGLLHEIVASLVLARRLLELGPMDDAYAERVVDRVLLPVLRAADPDATGCQ
jgi:hypothetical protein